VGTLVKIEAKERELYELFAIVAGPAGGTAAVYESPRANLLQRRIKMAVKKIGEEYRCNICGNEVTVTKAGGGTLVCCGEDMERVSS